MKPIMTVRQQHETLSFMEQLDDLARRVRNQLPEVGETVLRGVNEQDERLIRTAMSLIKLAKS